MLLFTILLQLFSGILPGMETLDPMIRTVQIFSETPRSAMNQTIVTPLDNQRLRIEFDDLRDNTEQYYAKIIHCNWNWEPSGLRDLEFLSTYNEFNINDFAYSSNTHVPYVHYRFEIPEVKIPGNYVLIVYKDGDLSKRVLTRRFMVFGNQAIAAPNIRAGQMALDRQFQQIHFSVNYQQINLSDPLRELHVVLRQNQRWDNAITGLQPTEADAYRKTLEYTYFDRRGAFEAGNEFRFVDFTSVNFPGQNTGYMDKTSRPFHLYVAKDKPRGSEVYAQYRDLNGQGIIENRDGGYPETAGQYLYVHFLLDYQPASGEEVWVSGLWSDWSSEDKFKMKKTNNGMEASVLLKQGFYNYRYTSVINGKPTSTIEGNYAETENDYEILVYYRDFRLQVDVLAGYAQFKINPR